MRINFDFGDLEAFLAVAETRSFQAAARQLNVSQSAITRRIKKLEGIVGVVLFERTTRTVTPTLAAKRFAERAQHLIDDAEASARLLTDETDRFEHQRNSIVTVAAVPSAIPGVLVPAIDRFRATGRRVRIKIIDQLANGVAESVTNGEADFGLSSVSALDQTITFEPILEDDFALAVHESHPMAGLDQITWEALGDLPLIVPLKGTGNRMIIDEAIARSDTYVPWTFEVSRTTTALELVKAGQGVAVLPNRSATDAQIRTVPLVSPAIHRTIGLISRSNTPLRPVAQAFAEACRMSRPDG